MKKYKVVYEFSEMHKCNGWTIKKRDMLFWYMNLQTDNNNKIRRWSSAVASNTYFKTKQNALRFLQMKVKGK